ncbi:MAG: tetratricopeptide repeat protein [Flavobacteriaceae bacterium]
MQLSHDDDYDFSITKFEKMLKTNNVFFFDSVEFERIIQFYLESGKVALAKKAIKIGLEQHPSSITLMLFKVELYVFEDKLDLAEKCLDQLYHLDPSNEEVFIQKATICSKRDEHAKAIDILKIALNLSEEKVDIYALLGVEYLYLEDFEAAKKCYEMCIELDNHDYAALYNIIYCFDFLEQPEEAIEFINKFLDMNPYSEIGWHQLGKQFLHKDEYKKALAAFDFAIISDDTFIGAYFEKGKVLEKLNRYNEAIENYLITLEFDDPTSFAYLRIGKCYEKLNNKDLALQYYYKTVHEDPLLDKGWQAITDFYFRQKNYQKALYYINKAIEIDGEHISYWKRYAQVNFQLNFFEEAERGFQKIIELGNYEVDIWTQRADVLLILGEKEAAIQNLLQGLEFHPEDAEIEFRLAGIYYLLNAIEKGQYHLVNALKNNADFVIILEEVFPDVYTRLSVQKLIQKH